MAKAIVPVVLKMFAEADASIEGAVKAVSNTIQTAAKTSLNQVTLSTETIVKNTAQRASKAISEARVSFISERDLSLARTGLASIDQAGNSLNQSLAKLQERFFSIAKAGGDLRTSAPFDKSILKASEYYNVLDQLKVAYAFQKRAAEELAKAPPADLVKAQQQLTDAKLLTKELTAQANQIKAAYSSAFNETATALTKLEREINKKTPIASGPVQGPQLNPQRDLAASLELQLVQQVNRVLQSNVQIDQLRKKIDEDRLKLNRQISDVTNQESKTKLQTGQANLQNLAQAAVLSRQSVAQAQEQLQRSLANQQKAAISNSADIQRFKVITEQSRVLVSNLEKDAKKAEQAYSRAFQTIQSTAEKALKTPISGGGGGAGRISAGLGIFSPLANQLSSTIDGIIGNLTGASAIFRTTAGVQIGQAISQGIGQGLSGGADFAKAGVDDIISQFAKLDAPSKQLIANIGTGIVVAAAASGAALLGLAGVTLKVASDFEVLTAKLTTTFKDPTIAVGRFQEALDLAAKTPYNVEQVVAAQVQLSALGQKNIDILRDTVDLASGLNADLARTANEVGKAAAGSLRGYQELRNTLGITQERLKQFGGVVDSQNRLLVTNEFQIRKNREALLALIRTDFGGSSERLSQTLQGRISNLQDEIIKLSGAIGSAYLPNAKAAVSATTGLIQYLNDLPQSFKTFAAGAIATAGSLGIMTAGLAATSLALGILGSAAAALNAGALAGFVGAIPGAALAVSTLDLALNGIAVKTIPLLGSNLATAAGPLGLLVIAAGLLNTAFVHQQEEAERTGQFIKAYSKDIAEARRANLSFQQDLIKTFNFPKDFIKDTDDAATVLAKLDKEFKSRGALAVVQDLELAGITLESVTEKYVEQNKQLDVQKDRLKTLRELRDEISIRVQETNKILGNKDLDKPVGVSNLFQSIEDFAKVNPAIEGMANSLLNLKGSSADALSEVDKFIFNTAKNVSRLEPAVIENKLLTESINAVREALDKVQKPLEKLSAPAKFALKVGDLNLINKELENQQKLLSDIDASINSAGLRAANAKGAFSIEEASSLIAGASDANKILLEGFIKTNETITELSNKRFAAQAEQDKIRLQYIEANEKSELALIDGGNKEKQLSIVKSAIAIVQTRADQYKKDIATYIEVQDALTAEQDAGERFRLQNLLDRNKDRIKAEKEAFDFFIEQKKKQAQLEKQIDAEKYKDLKAQLDTFIKDTKQIASGAAPTKASTRTFIGIDGKEITVTSTAINKLFDDLEARPLTAAEKIKVLTQRLNELRTLQSTTNFIKLGSSAEEAKKAFRDNEREIEEAIARARIERGKENIKNDKTGKRESFQDFKLNVDKELADSINKTDKLKVVQDALAKLKTDEVKSHIRINDFRAEEAKLTKTINDLQTDINQQLKAQTRELETLRQSKIKDEIEILEARRDEAKGADRVALDSQLKGRKKQAIQAEFLELKAEQDAELAEAVKNGKSRELILQKYAEKQEALVRKAYLDHKKAEDDKLKATLDRFKAEDDALKSFRDKRLGGANSPIISLEELSFQSTLPGFGSDAQSRADRELDKFATPGKAKIPSYESFRTKFEQENNLKLGKNGGKLPSSFDDLQPISTGPSTQIDATIIIDGSRHEDRDLVKDAAKLVGKAMKSANKKVKLLSGNDADDLDASMSPGGGLDLSFKL